MAARKKRRRTLARTVLLLVFTLAAGLALGSLLFPAPEQKALQLSAAFVPPEVSSSIPASHWERKDRFYTILCAGADDGNGGSDTILLMAVDADNGTVYGVSIPRDTKAIVNGKAHKINAAYNTGGISLLAQVVSEQLGVPVDYTVLVDLKGFAALVDEIGGVDFEVPLDMDYDDPVQGLSIHIPKGTRHLDGAEALKVVRFRHNNDGSGYGTEDIGRMETQQRFLKAVARQLLTPASLIKLDRFVKIFDAYVETDLSVGNLAWLGKEIISMGAESVDFSTLPGTWKSPYIHVDAASALELVNERLNPYKEPRTAEDLHIPA